MSTESASSLIRRRSPALTASACASVSSPSKTEFCTQWRWRLRNLCTFVTLATSTSYTIKAYISRSRFRLTSAPGCRLPPGAEARVWLHVRQVLDQLVALQAHQPLVAHLAPQPPVLDGRLQARVPLPKDDLAAGLLQVAAVQVLREVPLGELPVVQELEDHPVGEDRLEDFGQVERQREAARPRLVQEAHRRVELRAVDLRQRGGVDQPVREGDERVDPVVGRPARALAELLAVAQYPLEPPVVGGACAPLAAHQLLDRLHSVQPQHLGLHGLRRPLQLDAPAGVVAQVPQDVVEASADELARDLEPEPPVGVVAHLADDEVAGVQVLARVEGAGVEAVVVEEVDGDSVAGEEDEHERVQIQLAEDP